MVNNEILRQMQEQLFWQNNDFYKGTCITTSKENVEIGDIQDSLSAFEQIGKIKGIEVSPLLYIYLKYSINYYTINKKEDIYPETLYGYPIAINPKLRSYGYRILRKEKI